MKKASEYRYLEAFRVPTGRCERIRTFDPLHPMQVRYQAAPHTELAKLYAADGVTQATAFTYTFTPEFTSTFMSTFMSTFTPTMTVAVNKLRQADF